jgi:phosphonate transport system substrate-binding protein
MSGADLHRRLFCTSVFAALAVSKYSTVTAANTKLRIALVPQENPEKLLGDLSKVTAVLSARIGVPVEGIITFDHAAAVEALRNGDADIAFMGALPYVLAESQMGAVPLLSEVYRGSPTYKGRVFVRRDSGLETLASLRGRDIAFADPISESGYLYPLDLFVQAGLIDAPNEAENFFRRVYFAGGYQQAMQAMSSGLVDAACASEYADLLLAPDKQVNVIWIKETAPIPAHLVVARPDLNADLKKRFVNEMLALNNPENQHLLAYLYGPDGYVTTDAAAYQGVREIAQRYGLLP